jgi:hypothetical protein
MGDGFDGIGERECLVDDRSDPARFGEISQSGEILLVLL